MYAAMKCLELLVLTIFFVAGVLGRSAHHYSPSYDEDYPQSNSLSPIPYKGPKQSNWVKVNQTTSHILRVSQGQRVELVCEGRGSPAPNIQWFKGFNTPLTKFQETNEIPESNAGIGDIVSKYIIECAQPRHQGVYTCRGTAGVETAVSLPTALFVEESIPSLFSRPCPRETKPKIISSRSFILKAINDDVLLTCNAQGNPKPDIVWLNEENNTIDHNRDSRFKVLPSGDLSILRVRWKDVGTYVCRAENRLGRDEITTFLYPFKVDK